MSLKDVEKTRRKRTLASDLMFWFILTIVVGIIIFGVINYFISISPIEKELNYNANRIINKISKILAIHLWTLDVNTIHKISEEKKSSENIVMLKVYDDFNEVITYLGTLDENKEYIVKKKDIFYKGYKVGHVEIALDTENIQIAKMTMIRSIIISILGVILTIIVVTKVLIQQHLVEPLNKLMEGVESIRQGDLNYIIKVLHKDEIGELASAFNQMTEDLKTSHEKIKKHEKDLEKEVEKRTKELESKLEELEKFHRLTIGRELKLIELKKKIKELEEKVKDRK